MRGVIRVIIFVEVVRILAFALVNDQPEGRSSVCRMRLKNPEIYHYDNIFVEARSDRTEPYFLLPLHAPNDLRDTTSCEYKQSHCLNWHPNRQGGWGAHVSDVSIPLSRGDAAVGAADYSHCNLGYHVGRNELSGALTSVGFNDFPICQVSVHQDESLFLPGVRQDSVRVLREVFCTSSDRSLER